MDDGDIIIHNGWLDVLSETGSSTWGKLSGKKQWKRRFVVLKKLSSNCDEIYLDCYDKDDQWRATMPKRSLRLFPRYKISKTVSFKGRENALEVNNESEKWYLSSDKMKNLDLWACQIQMQTKLSRAISGRIFCVSGAVDKDMQRIGAAQQRCLMHFTKWGITLALQESRSVLAMWPFKTIRNYEESGHCQFTIEAGRRAPMGEGVYRFNTNISQDKEMFNVMDLFVNALINEQAFESQKKPATDEEILQTYDQLYKTAIGYNTEPPHISTSTTQNTSIDTPGYSHIGEMSGRLPMPRNISIHKPPDYNRLFGPDVDCSRVQLDEKKISPSDSFIESPRAYSFSDDKNNYDKLGRGVGSSSQQQSLVNHDGQGPYDHIQHNNTQQNNVHDNTYDRIDRSEHGSFKARSQGASWGIVGYPLHGEPSVPCLDGSYKDKTSVTHDDQKFVFRNSIYSVMGASAEQYPQRRSTNSSQDFNAGISTRHDSTSSEGKFTRRKQNGTSFPNSSHQDIANHFMYQVPSSLTSDEDSFGYMKTGDPIRGGLVDPTLTGDTSGQLVGEASSVDGPTASSESQEKEKPDVENIYLKPRLNPVENSEVYQNSESVKNSVVNTENDK